MGEIADMVLEGTLCQVCGEIMYDMIPDGDEEAPDPPGYPRTCAGCQGRDDEEEKIRT